MLSNKNSMINLIKYNNIQLFHRTDTTTKVGANKHKDIYR